MSLIDSHCHLEMLDDAATAVDQAHAAGVAAVVSIGTDLPSSRQAAAYARELPGVYAAVALHPHEAHTLSDELLAELERLTAEPRVVAVGECGLDFYRDLSPRDAQRRAFSAQIALLLLARLPLVVHVREAGEEALVQLAAEASDLTVVLHCFALPEHVDECNARGYSRQLPAGNVTYKNAGALRAAAVRVREDRIMVETDAPFLSPVPNRGKPNTPAWVRHGGRGRRGARLERAAPGAGHHRQRSPCVRPAGGALTMAGKPHTGSAPPRRRRRPRPAAAAGRAAPLRAEPPGGRQHPARHRRAGRRGPRGRGAGGGCRRRPAHGAAAGARRRRARLRDRRPLAAAPARAGRGRPSTCTCTPATP